MRVMIKFPNVAKFNIGSQEAGRNIIQCGDTDDIKKGMKVIIKSQEEILRNQEAIMMVLKGFAIRSNYIETRLGETNTALLEIINFRHGGKNETD
jgi:hypothetical protein